MIRIDVRLFCDVGWSVLIRIDVRLLNRGNVLLISVEHHRLLELVRVVYHLLVELRTSASGVARHGRPQVVTEAGDVVHELVPSSIGYTRIPHSRQSEN